MGNLTEHGRLVPLICKSNILPIIFIFDRRLNNSMDYDKIKHLLHGGDYLIESKEIRRIMSSEYVNDVMVKELCSI